MWGTIDLSQPLVRGFSAAPPYGTLTDPIADSFVAADAVNTNGAVGLDSHTFGFFSAGLWHLHITRDFAFTGTTNVVSTSTLNLQGGLNPVLGTPSFTVLISRMASFTGHLAHYVQDIWLPMLDLWALTRVISPRVAGDLADDGLYIIGRRFI